MTTSSALLKQILAAHGDALYRMALLLAGNEHDAGRLLQRLIADLVAAWGDAPPATPPDEPDLLAALIALAQQEQAKRQQRRRPSSAGFPPLYRSVFALPLDQRSAVALMLINGYDLQRIAATLGQDEAATRTTLITAIRALAPAAGQSLTDRISSDFCHEVRAALADPAGRVRHSAAVRGHLAGCAPCRSFDLTWGEVGRDVEAALRAVLRDLSLPAPLAERLLRLANPRARRAIPWRNLRFALPPLAVLVVVAALVLPGFTRRSVTVVSREETAQVDPQVLVDQALDRYGVAPESGFPVWYGRFETLWYFDDETIAPLHAEFWLDRDMPARHRIQLSHADGGAPYELQLGDGRDRLYYALDAGYAPALYGSLNLRIEPEQPLLLPLALEPSAQREALQTRLGTGPWIIPPFYLRQAAKAGDLRLLGRQRNGERTVQILSFSGVSPFARPIDAPGATAERVTVLLAIDPSDGLLYSATELAGPPGGVQTSRITWQLIEEDTFQIVQGSNPFSIDRAWNGIGEFPRRPRPMPADLSVPAISAASLIDPLRLLERGGVPFYVPSAPPAGTDRALLFGNFGQTFDPRADGLLYLGPQRMLLLRPIHAGVPPASEEVRIDSWEARLTPGRNQRYTARLVYNPDNPPSIRLLIEAYGFTRAELLDVIASLQPFDLDVLAAQQELFARPEWGDVEARMLILNSVAATQNLPADQVRYTSWRTYTRHGPAVVSADPYLMPPFYGRPENDVLDIWQAGDAGQISLEQLGGADPAAFSVYRGSEQAWVHMGAASTAMIFRFERPTTSATLPQPYSYLLEFLGRPDVQMARRPLAEGSNLVSLTAAANSGRYAYALTNPTTTGVYLADVRPLTITTEVEFDPGGTFRALRVFGSGGAQLAEPVLIESYELESEAILPLAEAPQPFSEGMPPPADLTIDLERPQITDQVYTLAEIVRRVESPVFVLPRDRAALGPVVAGSSADVDIGSTLIQQAIDLQLGAFLLYRVPALENTTVRPYVELRVMQGPAAPLRAYLRSTFDQDIWEQGTPLTTNIAGREVTAWIGTIDTRTRLVAEIDGTLILAEGPSDWFEREAIPLLAELQQA